MKLIAEGKNYRAINIGSLNDLNDYTYLHSKLKTELLGKLFLGEFLGTTGMEISIRDLPPKSTIPFLHKHYEHEEVYIILKGKGMFQVDNDTFELSEGSVVRVDTDGNRTLGNTQDYTMIYMVIQARRNTLNGYDVNDGYRTNGEIMI